MYFAFEIHVVMKKIIALLLLVAFIAASCGSSKQGTDYDKVDKSFEDFKDRNPDSD